MIDKECLNVFVHADADMREERIVKVFSLKFTLN